MPPAYCPQYLLFFPNLMCLDKSLHDPHDDGACAVTVVNFGQLNRSFSYLCQELEALKSELEDSLDTTAAAHELRGKREQEVTEMKRVMDEDARSHEAAIQDLRHKYTQQLEESNDQLDQLKKVSQVDSLIIIVP